MKVLIDDGLRIQLGTGIGNYCLYLYKSLKNKNCNVELSDYKATSQNRKLKRLQYILYINGTKFRKKAAKWNMRSSAIRQGLVSCGFLLSVC